MTWGDLSGFSTFEKARRKELGRKLTRVVRGKDPEGLLSLDDLRERLDLYEQWYVGIQNVPLSKIVGSVDRAADFDRGFLPKRAAMEERWKRVEQAFRAEPFPPIIAFKLDDAYFIEDGHHRVAIANQRKDEFIDADVTEVRSPVPITSSTNVADIVHLGLRQWFMRESGLDQIRPRANIDPSRPHSYAELLDIVHAAGFELMMQRETVVSPAVAAAHWYDKLYLPAVKKISAGNLPKLLPKATETDLYLRVHAQHRELVSVTAPHSVDDAVGSAESVAANKLTAKTRLVVEEVKEKLAPSAGDDERAGQP